MATSAAPGPRIDAARQAAGVLVDSLPALTPFGAITYGAHSSNSPSDKSGSCHDITPVVPFGAISAPAARASLSTLKPGGYTPIGESLTRAVAELPDGKGVVVLISDGIDTCAPPDPCETAKSLAQQHPDLVISTVGLRTSGDGQLSCIAAAGRGYFVTADNSSQLANRLVAARLADTAPTLLSPTGFEGLSIGMTVAQVAKAAPDFPTNGTSSGTRIVYVWRDCDYSFDNGVLTSIAPHSARTIDGLAVGATMTQAAAVLGDPAWTTTTDGRTVSYFPTWSGGPTWQLTSGADGTILTIALCACSVQQAPASIVTPGQVAALGVCNSRCVLTAQSQIIHPVWGRVTAATLVDPGGQVGYFVVVDAAGRLLWHVSMDVWTDESMRTDLKMARDGMSMPTPAQDATGNVFFTYNPGRYNGVVVLRPDGDGFSHYMPPVDTGVTAKSAVGGFTPLSSGASLDYGSDGFYDAEIRGTNASGFYRIEQMMNDCNPDCAGGTESHYELSWDGGQYVAGVTYYDYVATNPRPS